MLDVLNKVLGLVRVERDARARGACSCCTSCSVDVGLSFFGWLNLNDEIDIWNVESSGSNVSGAKDSELALLEALHCDFTLVLSDVSMHNFNVLLDFVRKDQRVAVGFSLRENDGLAVNASVAHQDVSQRRNTILEGAADSEVLHVPGGLVLQVLAQINDT